MKKLLLLLAALIWGVAFVAQSVGMDYMGPFTFNGARFLMGSAVLVPVILFRRKKADPAGGGQARTDRSGAKENAGKAALMGGVCCGLALCPAALFQQFGILYTTVGKAGFITTLYIILVPLAGIFMKKTPSSRIWTGAALAAFGFYLLCIKEGFSLSRGDALVFIGSVLFTVHILVIDHFSPKADGVELSCIQFLTAGVISSVLAFVFEKPELSALAEGIIPLAYAGILSSGVAYTLQVIGQRDTDPAVASLLLSMESVFSVLAGWMLLGQALSARELMGCALVFGAVILVQLPTGKRRPDKKRA
jgi:drug/metabolite transporter (DMT)-like permease